MKKAELKARILEQAAEIDRLRAELAQKPLVVYQYRPIDPDRCGTCGQRGFHVCVGYHAPTSVTTIDPSSFYPVYVGNDLSSLSRTKA